MFKYHLADGDYALKGMGTLQEQTQVNDMDDEKISLRIGGDELREIDAYLAEHPELGSRSLFIRTAVREYIRRDADVSAGPEPAGNGVFVRLTEAQMAALDALVGTIYFDREAVMWSLVSKLIGAEGMAESEARKAFQMATSNIPQ